jgi:pilus assembly protein CpaF
MTLGSEDADLIGHYGRPIAGFLEDPAVTEICVTRFDRIYVERDGRLELTEARFPSEQDLVQYIMQVGNRLNQRPDPRTHPLLDARFENGTRFNAVLAPTAVFGSCISIRPFPKTVYTTEDLIRFGALTPTIVRIFETAIERRLNIVVAGGTGSGKTTVLRCLCQHIAADERIITVEDTSENLVPHHTHVEAFEAAKRQVLAGTEPVTMGRLIENALRRRPDRIIVGEMRSPEAAAAFVDAINTGHAGSITTLHANGTEDALARIEMLYARQAINFTPPVIAALVRGNVDLVIHAVKGNEGGRFVRRVKDVLWVEGGAAHHHLIRHHHVRGYETDDAALKRFEAIG